MQRKSILFWKLIVVLGFSTLLASCASLPKETEIPAPVTYTGPRKNIMHSVAPGETFWRISKMYNVPTATILSANNMEDSTPLKMGQELLIPDAAPVQPVITLYPSEKWRYIIIHHSATEQGTSLSFHHSHLQKGWDRGVGYHFVIDNDKSGKSDGQIETTPRWLKQEDGAHCKASDMNTKAIGICLVGNFNDDRVTAKQMESLTYLVNELRHYYKIPKKRILQHGEVEEALTDCPGNKFPWDTLMQKL